LLVLTVSLRSGGMSVNSLTNDLYRSLIRICEVYQYGNGLENWPLRRKSRVIFDG